MPIVNTPRDASEGPLLDKRPSDWMPACAGMTTTEGVTTNKLNEKNLTPQENALPPLRIIFAGTPEFSVPCLQALLNSPHSVVAVYTQPDRKAGRGQHLQESPIKTLALSHQIPVFQPTTLKQADAIAELVALQADVMIVVAYGLILPQAVLDAPRYGCINVHASLLPRWRGAAPIQWALLEGDSESGVTIMQMEAGLDTGPMLHKIPYALSANETGETLHDHLSHLGAEALIKTLADLQHGDLHPEIQADSEATYAHKIAKTDARIDWQQPVRCIERKIRAFNPWPIAYTTWNAETLRIYQASARTHTNLPAPGTVIHCSAQGLEIAASDGIIAVTHLQFPGGKVLPIAEIIKSREFIPGHVCL
jgi:methionyl-tRNA formyltransferase